MKLAAVGPILLLRVDDNPLHCQQQGAKVLNNRRPTIRRSSDWKVQILYEDSHSMILWATFSVNPKIFLPWLQNRRETWETRVDLNLLRSRRTSLRRNRDLNLNGALQATDNPPYHATLTYGAFELKTRPIPT